MAINERIGILTRVPGSDPIVPGLIDGVYAEFKSKEFDFLDDISTQPTLSDFTSSPAYWFGYSQDPQAIGGDWEDLGSSYRWWRDAYKKYERENWLARTRRFPQPFESIVIDPTPWKQTNPVEMIRFVVPSPTDFSFNYPYPEFPVVGDHYSFYNNRRKMRTIKTRLRFGSLTDMYRMYGLWEDMYTAPVEWFDPMATEVNDENGELIGFTGATASNQIGDIMTYFRARRDSFLWLSGSEQSRELTTSEQVRKTAIVDFLTTFDFVRFHELSDIRTITPETGYPGYSDVVTNHPFMVQALAVDKFNYLPSVDSESKLPTTGNIGDIVPGYTTQYDHYIWNHIEESFVPGNMDQVLEDIFTMERMMRDAKLRALNDIELAMKPYLFAGLYVPSSQLTLDGSINTSLK